MIVIITHNLVRPQVPLSAVQPFCGSFNKNRSGHLEDMTHRTRFVVENLSINRDFIELSLVATLLEWQEARPGVSLRPCFLLNGKRYGWR